MPDQEKKEEKELKYVQGYVSEGGYTIDATNIRKRLAKEAYERYTEKEEAELQQYTEEQYFAELYPKEHDEYLVEGAVLTCTMTTKAKKIYRDKKYIVEFPCERTTLSVTENIALTCCDLPHATIKDAKKKDDANNNNIPPFRCNCILAPYTDEEWAALEADEACLTEGTCRALMKLNDEWDNLPQADGEGQQVNDIPLISMGSILFCRHGGIIIPEYSGQIPERYLMKELEISKNAQALSNTSIQSATSIKAGTQLKIQNLCSIDGAVYFDENGFQRVKDTGLPSDPYLVAIAEYYQTSAIEENIGDSQGYGAIFMVTYSSGKRIFVTMGDLKNPIHTQESFQNEGKNYYAGTGKGANTLEFFGNYHNKNSIAYSENMSAKEGSDAYNGKASTITEGASITNIGLLRGVEIDWESRFEQENTE